MISKRYAQVVFITLMVIAMCLVMSLTMTIANHKLDSAIWSKWARAFVLGMLVAWPTAMLAAPLVRRIVDRICR